jgi:hypothetical protein
MTQISIHRSCSDKLIPREGERSQPLVSNFCFGVAETVWETDSSAFYLTKDTFDGVPISMSFVSEI